MKTARVCALMLALLCAAGARAHEVRPAYLQMTEIQPGRFEVLWKVPQVGDMVLGLHVRWPEVCRDTTPAARVLLGHAAIERRVLECGAGGLVGKRIEIDGLATTITDALTRIEFLDGRVQTNLVKPAAPSFMVQGRRPALDVAGEYLALGIQHILTGADHLLFVLGLLVIVRGAWRVVKTVTAFTVAHSVTLGMAALGFVRVPQAPVEAVIALSVLFLANEIMRQWHGDSGLTARFPWLVALTFGLLHGFGFAGALSEVGLPQTDIPLALAAFNVGVEVGQLLFICAVLALGWALVRLVRAQPAWWPGAAAYGIGSVSAYWVIARVAGFGL